MVELFAIRPRPTHHVVIVTKSSDTTTVLIPTERNMLSRHIEKSLEEERSLYAVLKNPHDAAEAYVRWIARRNQIPSINTTGPRWLILSMDAEHASYVADVFAKRAKDLEVLVEMRERPVVGTLKRLSGDCSIPLVLITNHRALAKFLDEGLFTLNALEAFIVDGLAPFAVGRRRTAFLEIATKIPEEAKRLAATLTDTPRERELVETIMKRPVQLRGTRFDLAKEPRDVVVAVEPANVPARMAEFIRPYLQMRLSPVVVCTRRAASAGVLAGALSEALGAKVPVLHEHMQRDEAIALRDAFSRSEHRLLVVTDPCLRSVKAHSVRLLLEAETADDMFCRQRRISRLRPEGHVYAFASTLEDFREQVLQREELPLAAADADVPWVNTELIASDQHQKEYLYVFGLGRVKRLSRTMENWWSLTRTTLETKMPLPVELPEPDWKFAVQRARKTETSQGAEMSPAASREAVPVFETASAAREEETSEVFAGPDVAADDFGVQAFSPAFDPSAWLVEAEDDEFGEAVEPAEASTERVRADADGAEVPRRTLSIRAGYVPKTRAELLAEEEVRSVITTPLSSSSARLRAQQEKRGGVMGRMTHQLVAEQKKARKTRKGQYRAGAMPALPSDNTMNYLWGDAATAGETPAEKRRKPKKLAQRRTKWAEGQENRKRGDARCRIDEQKQTERREKFSRRDRKPHRRDVRINEAVPGMLPEDVLQLETPLPIKDGLNVEERLNEGVADPSSVPQEYAEQGELSEQPVKTFRRDRTNRNKYNRRDRQRKRRENLPEAAVVLEAPPATVSESDAPVVVPEEGVVQADARDVQNTSESREHGTRRGKFRNGRRFGRKFAEGRKSGVQGKTSAEADSASAVSTTGFDVPLGQGEDRPEMAVQQSSWGDEAVASAKPKKFRKSKKTGGTFQKQKSRRENRDKTEGSSEHRESLDLEERMPGANAWAASSFGFSGRAATSWLSGSALSLPQTSPAEEMRGFSTVFGSGGQPDNIVRKTVGRFGRSGYSKQKGSQGKRGQQGKARRNFRKGGKGGE